MIAPNTFGPIEMKTTYYYVTMKRGSQTAYLVGPCHTHELALSLVETARKAANEVDPFTCFDAFGTTSLTWNHKLPLLPDGRLNKHIGFDDGPQRIVDTKWILEWRES